MKIHIIVPLILAPTQKSKLIELGVNYFATDPVDMKTNPSALSTRISDAEVIVIANSTPITADLLLQHPHLKLIQTVTAGADHIDLEAASKNNTVVKTLTNYSVDAVAERTIGMIIFGANRLQEANKDVKNGNWNFKGFRGKELRGKNLAVIGYGNIGRKVASLVALFGMNIQVVNSATSKEDFHRTLSAADFISVHTALTAATFHLFNDEAFSHIKDGSVFVNTSRGAIVDEMALLRALESNRISFAALDVLEEEPPSHNNPLIHHDRVFVTPHIAWNTEESNLRRIEELILNLETFIGEYKTT